MANTGLDRANAGVTFVTGQLLTATDVTRIQNASREVALELLMGRLYLSAGSMPTGFFGTDCLAEITAGLNYSVAEGLGFYYDSSISDAFTSQLTLIVVNTPITGALGTRDATHPRIDILCLAPDTTTDTSETINVMDGAGSTSSSSADRRTRYTRAFQVVAGTPAASPAVPSTPAGYIKIAQCAVPAVAGAVVLTDTRPLLVLSPGAIGAEAVDTAQIADEAITTAKIDDDAVTGVKMSITPVYAAMTAGAEAGNVITVDVQITDIDGNAMAGIYYVEFSLANLNGPLLTTGYSLTVGAAGTEVAETNDPAGGAAQYLLLTTNGSGVCNVVVTDATTGVNRGVRLIAQMMGAYGPRKYCQCPFN